MANESTITHGLCYGIRLGKAKKQLSQKVWSVTQ